MNYLGQVLVNFQKVLFSDSQG